jgi:hypothetical protein
LCFAPVGIKQTNEQSTGEFSFMFPYTQVQEKILKKKKLNKTKIAEEKYNKTNGMNLISKRKKNIFSAKNKIIC